MAIQSERLAELDLNQPLTLRLIVKKGLLFSHISLTLLQSL